MGGIPANVSSRSSALAIDGNGSVRRSGAFEAVSIRLAEPFKTRCATVALVALCFTFSEEAARAATVTCPDSNLPYFGQPGIGSLQPPDLQCFDWQGNWVAQAVSILHAMQA